MAQIELTLFGEPHLVVDGRAEHLSRPIVLECIAVIILAGQRGVSREELAGRLWCHLRNSANQRNQLRGTLTKLRADLKSLQLSDFFDLEGRVLRVAKPVANDLYRLLENPPKSYAELRPFVEQIGQGWDRDHWQRESDLAAVTLAKVFANAFLLTKDPQYESLLARAVKSHPTSATLAELYARWLSEGGNSSAANEAIIAFEDAWVDRFGNVDIPKLEASSASPLSLAVPSRNKSLYLLAFGCSAALAATGFVYLGINQPKRKTLELSLVQSFVKTIDGHDFQVRKFHLGNAWADTISFQGVNQKDFAVSLDKEDQIVISGTNSMQHKFPVLPLMLEDSGSTVRSTDIEHGFTVKGKVNLVVSPTHDTPQYGTPTILSDGSLLIRGHCDHPFVCHHKLWHFYDGCYHSVFQGGSTPQIIVGQQFTDTTVFGKYSYGKSEGWRYHTFAYDIRTHEFRTLNVPTVASVLSKDIWVCLPEVTEKRGDDYESHGTGEVAVIDSLTNKVVRRRLIANGQQPTIAVLPPYIVNSSLATQLSCRLTFLDSELKECNPFPEIPAQFQHFQNLSSQMLVLVPFDKMRHSHDFWVITREDPI